MYSGCNTDTVQDSCTDIVLFKENNVEEKEKPDIKKMKILPPPKAISDLLKKKQTRLNKSEKTLKIMNHKAYLGMNCKNRIYSIEVR